MNAHYLLLMFPTAVSLLPKQRAEFFKIDISYIYCTLHSTYCLLEIHSQLFLIMLTVIYCFPRTRSELSYFKIEIPTVSPACLHSSRHTTYYALSQIFKIHLFCARPAHFDKSNTCRLPCKETRTSLMGSMLQTIRIMSSKMLLTHQWYLAMNSCLLRLDLMICGGRTSYGCISSTSIRMVLWAQIQIKLVAYLTTKSAVQSLRQ
jgi:hypothetical protein